MCPLYGEVEKWNSYEGFLSLKGAKIAQMIVALDIQKGLGL